MSANILIKLHDFVWVLNHPEQHSGWLLLIILIQNAWIAFYCTTTTYFYNKNMSWYTMMGMFVIEIQLKFKKSNNNNTTERKVVYKNLEDDMFEWYMRLSMRRAANAI